MKGLGIFILMVSATVMALAQDFDSDSIYYTPIEKFPNHNLEEEKLPVVTDQNKVSYFFFIQSGALVGCKDCTFKREISFSTSTVHGITLGNKLRIGAGIGLDTYQNWQTLPIFGSISWDLFGNKNKNALFIQFNYGWAKARENKYTFANYQIIDGGSMISTQVGYRIRYHDLRIALGVGSKYQKVSASYQYPSYYYDYINNRSIEGDLNTVTLRESLKRFSLMMAIGWK